MTAAWNETTLPTLLSNYELKDVFKGEKYSGGKKSKVKLTGKNCFKNVKCLPCHYKVQKKSWMDIPIF